MYSIYENTTGALLVDHLTFDQAAEQSLIYMDFFETADISVVEETTYNNYNKYSNIPAEYKSAFISYFAELQDMGNLL